MKNEWNPVFYVAFIPLMALAFYLIVCALGGMCSKERRDEARRQRQIISERQARDADSRSDAQKRIRPKEWPTGPGQFRRG